MLLLLLFWGVVRVGLFVCLLLFVFLVFLQARHDHNKIAPYGMIFLIYFFN